MGGRVYDDLGRAWVDTSDGEFMGEVPRENWVLTLAGGEESAEEGSRADGPL